MKYILYSPRIKPLQARNLKRPLITACSALALALTISACGEQVQDQQSKKSAAKQGAQTSQKAESKMQKPAAKQGAAMGKTQGMGKGSSSDMQAPKGKSMTTSPPSPEFQALDTNHDGQVTTKEAASDPVLVKSFKKLDDGDGQLDKTEFSAFKKSGDGSSMGSAQTGGAKPSGAVENPNRPK